MRTPLAFGIVAATLLLAAYLVTHGSFSFLEREPFGAFYDAQMGALLHGRLDVEPAAIGGEAFVRNGKYYGYFGPTPALLRLPLYVTFAELRGRWSRLSMLTMTAVTLLAALLVFRLVERWWPLATPSSLAPALFLFAAGIGSTSLFLTSRASTYHEAIGWASAFALLACYAGARYVEQPSGAWQAGVLVLSGLSLLARQSTGVGPLVLCLGLAALLAVRQRASRRAAPLESTAIAWLPQSGARPARAALVFLAGACLISILNAGQNFAKMGTPLGLPLQYNLRYSEERLRWIDNRVLHLSNVPANLVHYFSPGSVRLEKGFPWIRLTRVPCQRFPEARFDMVEPYASLSAGMPALFLLALLGVASIASRPELRRLRLPLLGAVACGLPLLPLFAVSYRYMHDWHPALVVAGAAGSQALFHLQRPWRRLALGLCVVLALWSGFANAMFALGNQLDSAVDSDVARSFRYRQMRSRIDDLFRLEPLVPVQTKGPEPPSLPVRGQSWIVDADGERSVYWYNGEVWVLLDGPSLSWSAKLRVEFREKEDALEPLLSAGRRGAGSVITVRYLRGMRVAFGLERTGAAPIEGLPVKVEPGQSYLVDLAIDTANQSVLVRLDDRRVLRYCCGFPPASLRDVTLGENTISDVGEPRFTGRIWEQ